MCVRKADNLPLNFRFYTDYGLLFYLRSVLCHLFKEGISMEALFYFGIFLIFGVIPGFLIGFMQTGVASQKGMGIYLLLPEMY